jgi:DNA-binding SARP family transcriptional activator
MDFRILGPLEVLDDDRVVALGGNRQRALLGLLLVHLGETLSTERIVDELWGERPPSAAAKTVQVGVSRLRRALGRDDVVVTHGHGYRLHAAADQLDAGRFELLLAHARAELAADRAEPAAEALRTANAMWRGPPLADVAYEAFAQAEIARLAGLRVAARELEIEARLALGGHAEVVGPLEALIAEHPYREGLRAQLMLALYRSDRQAEALQAYQDARRTLVDELGIEPGERLRELEGAILAQDTALALARPARGPEPPRPPPEPARPARRMISVLVAAAGGGGDPEAMHAHLERAADAIARHGGTVEAFTGDAVVGAFGLAELHEDDALRAARAALELRDGGAALRLGADTGEVFVAAGARRATGDAFTVATGLAAVAQDDILLGERMAQLLGEVAELAPAAGGRRLLALRPAPAPTGPFVGRETELQALRDAFDRTREDCACELVTIAGPAGIGKSRLVRELVEEVGAEATVAIARCPSYGEDVTYRPLADIVAALGGKEIGVLLGEDADLAPAVLRAAGLGDGAGAQPDETFWAVRRLLEHAAARRPLVLVVEDAHWAQPSLLDLLDYVLAFSGAHAILAVCVGRPELLELRPAWAARRPGQALLALEPLDDADALRLVGDVQGAARIVERAEGNPLFLEQLAAMGADGELPATIQAVLAARIDRLAPGERDALERASVHGASFPVTGGDAARDLAALARKGLVRADRATPGVLRFAHALVRDAAYAGIPKERRAELHEQAAGMTGEDETAGHHLAAACVLVRELGRDGERERALAAAAAERLEAAGEAALRRGDAPAGAQLLERAAALAPARPGLVPRLGAALLDAGRLADADSAMAAALADPATGAHTRARASVERAIVRLHMGRGRDDGAAVAGAALPVLEAAGDELGLSRVRHLRAVHAWFEGRAAAADEDWRRAGEHAARAGDEAALLEIADWRASAALLGPLPVPDAIARCRELGEQVAASPLAVARTLHPLAALHAMAGEHDTAQRLLAAADDVLGEVHDLRNAIGQEGAMAEVLGARLDAAEARLRRCYARLDAIGGRTLLADTAAMLARVLHLQGRDAEAEAPCRVAEEYAAGDDLTAQVAWRGVRARLLAAQGHRAEAVRLAREAVDLAAGTDLLVVEAEALGDLCAVLRLAGWQEEADVAAGAAIALCERKGDVVSAARLASDQRVEGSDAEVRRRTPHG